jgi:hypothetical protein
MIENGEADAIMPASADPLAHTLTRARAILQTA